MRGETTTLRLRRGMRKRQRAGPQQGTTSGGSTKLPRRRSPAPVPARGLQRTCPRT